MKPTWKQISVEFIMRTKIHGLKFVFCPNKSGLQRVTWVVAFFVCISLLCVWSLNRIQYLMSYPAITKINMVWTHNMSFPAITLCNKNVFRVSTLTKEDLYHSGYWMDLMYPNHTVMEKSLSFLKDSHKRGLLNLLDFNNYSPRPNYHVNTTEMMGRLGHQLEEMLLECRFRGETCTSRNFSTVCTENNGVCQVWIWNVVYQVYPPAGQRCDIDVPHLQTSPTFFWVSIICIHPSTAFCVHQKLDYFRAAEENRTPHNLHAVVNSSIIKTNLQSVSSLSCFINQFKLKF